MRRLRKLWRGSEPRSVMRVKRELLKIDGKSVEVILRADPRARRFIVKVDPATGQVVVVSPTSRSLERALDFARGEREWIAGRLANVPDRKSTRLNASHLGMSYAVFCSERISVVVI